MTSDQLRSVAVPARHGSAEHKPGPRQLNCAVVGAGKMGQHHVRALQRLTDRARLVAVADPERSARDAVRASWPDVRIFSSLQQLLAESAVDVVHVCTSLETHAPMAMLALESGCHAYVEKPFAESAAVAERIIGLARARGLKLCAGHQLLYEHPAVEARRLLSVLGPLAHVESYFSFRTVRRSSDGRIPLRADLQLLDILPHPLSVLLRILEEVAPHERSEVVGVRTSAKGTLHALIRRGDITGVLVVTLEGRPVESYLRLVGVNGTVHADFVRGTVQRLIGPGVSSIEKVLNPVRLARQLAVGTTVALGGRVLRRQRGYPGLAEMFRAFYDAIGNDTESPTSPTNILESVRIWEHIAMMLGERTVVSHSRRVVPSAPRVLVTGGTGFLGQEIVRTLSSRGCCVRVLARREPAPWERVSDASYTRADLSRQVDGTALRDVDVMVHCAAETAGGWDAHQANSIDATENVLRAAAAAGVRKIIYISSLAVLAVNQRKASTEDSPLEPQSRERGPYVWGKTEAERLASRLGESLGLEVKIVRPGPLVDYGSFEPPGRLGKRVGNVFVAVGAPRDTVPLADVRFAAETVAWMVQSFTEAPTKLNLVSPTLPTKRELVTRLKQSNPDLTVVWLPAGLLVPLSWVVSGLQKVLRPGKPTVSIARVFAAQRCDTSRIAKLTPAILAQSGKS